MAGSDRTGWISKLSVVLMVVAYTAAQRCEVPKHFQGDWFSYELHDQDLNFLINDNGLSYETFSGSCSRFEVINGTADAEGRFHANVVFKADESDCYVCWYLLFRTPNVLQFKKSSLQCPGTATPPSLQRVCGDILPQSELLTMFRKTLVTINCKNTFEGVYHFTYEVDQGGGGICDSTGSTVVACQEPGSPYVDNQVFHMHFGKCMDVTMSANARIRFQCLGSWRDELNNKYAAVADLGKEIYRERFRCMLTRDDQQMEDNKRRWTMSKWARCNSIKSPYEGPYRLQLWPTLLNDPRYFVYGSQLVAPSCNFPRNFTGTWYTVGEFDTHVSINTSHIYFKTKIDQYTYREIYFTCQQNRDSRYLVTAVTVGKCEVDFVCFDFLPRHHNIIRWRAGKPYRMVPAETANSDFLRRKFRQACSWYSFTLDRNQIDWKYKTFLLNPPAPVDCPIAGRYRFEQKGAEFDMYNTRIRGITERPRHQIGCRQYVTEFKSCATNPKKIFVDAEYCETVDHTGRPIGEYDEPDRILNCVGHWMEDMRSYMITYDEEDAISKFRCWVYERLDWRIFVLSRATRGACGVKQVATSSAAIEGASLAMKLEESERLWDDCPQRFDNGNNPYEKNMKIYVVGGSEVVTVGLTVMLGALLSVWYIVGQQL